MLVSPSKGTIRVVDLPEGTMIEPGTAVGTLVTSRDEQPVVAPHGGTVVEWLVDGRRPGLSRPADHPAAPPVQRGGALMAAISAPAGAEYARILGVGGYRPSRVVTNAEICERIDSSDEWIRERSGIESRRWAAPDESVIDMSVAAAGKAIAQAGIRPEQVGAVLVATVTHPLQTPSAAAAVADRLGATDAAATDLSAACAGFCYGVSLANDMVRGGSAEYVLVIGCEKLSDFTDSYDRSTAFIFGDGAGAVVIGPSDEPAIGPTIWGSDGSQYDAITQRASPGSTCATTTSTSRT